VTSSPGCCWRSGPEAHVRELFADTGIEVDFLRQSLAGPPFDSVDQEIAFSTSKFGPLVLARRMLGSQGRWDALLADLRQLLETQGAEGTWSRAWSRVNTVVQTAVALIPS
jgi:hypothetical protein